MGKGEREEGRLASGDKSNKKEENRMEEKKERER